MRPLVVSLSRGSPEAFAAEIRAEAPLIEQAIRNCGAKVE